MNKLTSNYKAHFSLLSSLFFMWGFITVMNDVLINTFKGVFDLTAPQRALVQFSFFGAFFIVSLIYFILSSSTGRDPINTIGYKKGMFYSLLICGIGCLLFYPASLIHSYYAFLLALFTLASGVTMLQICANPYATILGDKESASSRLNQAQGLNSLGTTLGPIVGTILIYKVFSKGTLTVESIANTYLIYGLAFILLALVVLKSKMPAFRNRENIPPGLGVLKHKHLVFGILGIAFYVGSEVAIGSWIVEFIKLDHIAGLAEDDASYFLSFFWGGLMIGRLMAGISLNSSLTKAKKYQYMLLSSLGAFAVIYLATSLKYSDGTFHFSPIHPEQIAIYLVLIALNFGSFLLTFNKPAKGLVLFSAINAVLISIGIWGSGELAFWAMIGTGLFFSIGWSNIFSLAIKDLGNLTSQGSSLLVMAIVGGAVLPGIQSFIIEYQGVQISFVVPLIGIFYLIFYGLKGHKIKVR
ncbi:sugar MFS transporter [bacterium SCSIO 12741]|nr:sugar MFS transporter [bacterium SCSIO 12741]